MRVLCASVFWSTVVFLFLFSFTCVWLNYVLKKDFVVHTKGVVVISGTSSGIGHHATFALAEYGYTVFACVRNEKSVQSLKEESKIRRLENLVVPIIMDVVNTTQIDSGVKQVTTYLSKTGLPMVAIVNNAGFSGSAPIELEYSEHINKMFNVNFFGSVALTQKFLHLIRSDQGRLIFISSLGGWKPSQGRVAYASTKRAIEAVVDVLRLELEPLGVSVSSLVAGFVKTSIVENSVSNLKIDTNNTDYKEYFKREYSNVIYLLSKAPTPEVTSNAIVDAIRNPFPETRYFMGTVGNYPSYPLYLCSWLLSDRFFDVLAK